jgi:hypothetical protein
MCFVTYEALPSDGFVWFNIDERSNSSRFDDALASMARFEASKAARMSLFILVAQLDADSNRAGHHILRYVCPERLDYAAEVLPTALTALNIDSFVQGLLTSIMHE